MTKDLKPNNQTVYSSDDGPVVFRLYIAAGAPNSLRAQSNLRNLCDVYLFGHYQIETVDVLTEPRRALADGVLVTPTLIKVSPLPSWQMTGDLSTASKILQALDIAEEPNNE